ncbi:hypothetical protein ACFL0Z_02490 [Patescibacteria group bacterium]
MTPEEQDKITAEDFFEDGCDFLRASEILHRKEKYLHRSYCFLLHLCVETFIKSFILFHNNEWRCRGAEGHDLLYLANIASRYSELFERSDVLGPLGNINDYGYPFGGDKYLHKGKTSYQVSPQNFKFVRMLGNHIRSVIESKEVDVTGYFDD